MTRAAVVGLGGIAAEHLDKLERLEGVEVAGVCDLSRTLVDAVCERWRVGPGFTDAEALLAEVRPDAVHVLTPPDTHLPIVLAALEAGAHVFAEKPVAPCFGEYEQMRDAAGSRDLMLVENYNYRFMEVAERALAMVASGELGDPVNVDVAMGVGLAGAAYLDPEIEHFAHSLPGGAMRNFASHPASIASMVLEDWSSVIASQRRLTPGLASNDELRAIVVGERVSANLTITTNARPTGFSFAVAATEGTVEVDVLHHRLHVGRAEPATARITNGISQGVGHLAATASLVRRAVSSREGYFQGLERLMGAFYAAVAGHGQPPVTIGQMDRTNRLVEALLAPENQA